MKAIQPVLSESANEPYYMQLYRYLKIAILRGDITEGERLPSLRSLSKSIGLSITTIEKAYDQLLVEGYNVYIPVDCISSRSQIDYLWASERMEKAGAIVTTYESILYELLKDSKAEGFREISKIVK